MVDWKDRLNTIYFKPRNPAAFAGPIKLHKILQREGYTVGVHRIRQWLQDQDAYSLQKPVRRKFKRNRVITIGIDDLWDADLTDVSNLKKDNDNIHFLLIAIDVFSRYLWVVALKDKTHTSIIDGFKSIFDLGRMPNRIRTDKGSEFRNRWVKAFFTKSDVKHYVTHNETKANYAERVIRTLKALMYRYFTYKQTYKYIDIHVLQDLVYNYNHSPHRSLNGKTPADINKENETKVWNELYIDTLIPKPKRKRSIKKRKPHKKYKFKKGDYVRITHIKHPFDRDYQEKWTEEIFIVKSRYYRQGIPIYTLTDYSKDAIEGTFYQNELQKVNKNRDDLWRVDQILKKRKRKGKEELYVSFVGWPKKFNMWLPAENFQNL